jgi:hypothetical protein
MIVINFKLLSPHMIGDNEKPLLRLDSTGFWRRCITLGNAGFSDFVHRPKLENTFRKLDLLGREGLGVSPLTWGWKPNQFTKRCVLLEYRRKDKVQNRRISYSNTIESDVRTEYLSNKAQRVITTVASTVCISVENRNKDTYSLCWNNKNINTIQ